MISRSKKGSPLMKEDEQAPEMLSQGLMQRVLAYLDVPDGEPTLAFLDRLVASYVRRVPWESAFRIARRKEMASTAACARWPDIFWSDALQRGGGGTCFESNYAFLALLRRLGYDGYLTINDMGDHEGCHTAIVVWLEGSSWLVDVGLPLYVPLPIDHSAKSMRRSPFHTYSVFPDGGSRFQIERDRHPKRNCFTLIDRPVPDDAYRAATVSDYGPQGLFLERLIINKVVDEVPWRFNSEERPWRLESFPAGELVEHPLRGDVAAALAQQFSMDEGTLRLALEVVASEHKATEQDQEAVPIMRRMTPNMNSDANA